MENTQPTRRRLLSNSLKAAGGLALIASGGVVYKAFSEDIFSPIDGPAFQPWDSWKNPQPGAIGLAQAAILAANPHNTQPWRFLIHADRIELFADRTRHLGSFDPFRREMHLGLGCALENMELAGKARGLHCQIDYEGGTLTLADQREDIVKVATVTLTAADSVSSPLYQAIPNRHTNRFPYTGQPLPGSFLKKMQDQASAMGLRLDLIQDGQDRVAFEDLMNDATTAIIEDPEMIHDSHRWFRNNKSEVEQHRDGPFLDGAGIPKMMAAAAKMLPPTSPETSHKLWADATRTKHLKNAPLFGLISLTDRYDKASSLAAGQLWQRLHLMATVEGIAAQPMNQPIEWVDRLSQLKQENIAERRLQKLIKTNQWQPTFAFRMGYSTQVAVKSPRRDLTDRLVERG